jgi:hypothetical protein
MASKYHSMGFEEFAQKSLSNNRGLIKSTLNKYFRNKIPPAANEKQDLSNARLQIAIERKAQRLYSEYILYILIFAIAVMLLVVFLGE